MNPVFLLLSIASICVMIYALVSVIRLNNRIPGGTVGATWRFLRILIALFTAGYLTTPFFSYLSEDVRLMIVGVIFLSGAVFVVIVIKLFYKVIQEIGL